MFQKSKGGSSHLGQAAVEYLLTVAAVFIAFTGAAVLFSGQVDRYLAWLLETLVLPL